MIALAKVNPNQLTLFDMAPSKPVTSTDLPLDWNVLDSADERAAGIHAESISDGLILSLSNLGAVDIEYIAQVSGSSCKEAIEALKGSIYQNPESWGESFSKGWETADEYLSGNLMRKYWAAYEANEKYNGYFSDNIDAIKAVVPASVPVDEIYITLGSPWVPPDIIDDFIEFLFPETCSYRNVYSGSIYVFREMWPVKYESVTGTWEIECKTRFDYDNKTKSTKIYGTHRMNALHIIEKTLNAKTLQVFDTVSSNTTQSGERRQLNKDETIAAQEKQKLLIEEFQKWVWKDKARKERLETIFKEKFGCVRQRRFDGSFLTLPGKSPEVELYPYQKDAIARILFTPNTLLAHDVGAGKTYIMAGAGMELRRMGISRKNMYVMPNNIVGQWREMFLRMYPHARLLIVDPKAFAPGKRQDALKSIRDEDFDAIIIAYSCFNMIPLSNGYQKQKIEAELRTVCEALATDRFNYRLRNRRDKLKKKREDMVCAANANASNICFDALGITCLFLDEAHNYKNISIGSKIDNVLGISKTGSAKCNEMLDKVRAVQRAGIGRGVVFATGTPITNSVTDIFVMQTYLQYGELKFLDLHHFDNWALSFGEKATEFEVDVDTSGYRLATRFSKFHNLPELTNLLAQIADFHAMDKCSELPRFEGYEDLLVAKTPTMTDYLKSISERAEAIRRGSTKRTEDNMLKLTTDGRKAALDIRLALSQDLFNDGLWKTEYNSPEACDCKVFRCAENVFRIYRESSAERLTQLVFCDSSTPKAEFNMYDELRSLLIRFGVPAEEIAFVHDYDTEPQRKRLFSKMQSGEIRILLGSTFKLGMGVNVQRKLYALHHLDVPWRPADMIQREGRILRQGNENEGVKIFRYITDGSFDAYSWQLLESKQRFICQLLSGSIAERSASDVDDVVLSYAEIKALAIGNPLIKKRVETHNELKRVCSLQRKLVEAESAMKQELFENPKKAAHVQSLIEKAASDIERYAACRIDFGDAKKRRQIGAAIIAAAAGHVMQAKEKTLMTYQGFNVVLPQNMLKEKPAVWLVGSGRYYTELGESDVGCITRLDNKLGSLPEFIEKQRLELQRLAEQKAHIEAELAKEHPYDLEIEKLQKTLEKIDKKLGVEEEDGTE